MYNKAQYDCSFIGLPSKNMLFKSIYEPNVEPDYDKLGLNFEKYVQQLNPNFVKAMARADRNSRMLQMKKTEE